MRIAGRFQRLFAFVLAALAAPILAFGSDPPRRDVPREHPRLFGSLAELQTLARTRPEAYTRMAAAARRGDADDHSLMMSSALVAAIEGDPELGRCARQLAMKYIEGPIRKGHVPFGADLALCAVAYDLCHPWWPDEDKQKFYDYMNRTVDANVDSETHVFHNAWYGYKNWGIGLACYATYHANPRAPEILAAIEHDYQTRAAPALELAGAGGGWAEGYYVHYWLYEWLMFCEAARRCAGVDYFALAPQFYRQRAVASMFEMVPGIGQYGSRQPASMGDGGGRRFGGDRDKALAARRILVQRFRDDPDHQAVHAFDEATPRSSVGNYAYKDFLWRDSTVEAGDLGGFRLSHVSPGPGYVYARSSWDDDATWFFFKCGDRFTAHQHLDVGHFLIYKHAELAGDGGHYDDFGSPHDVNYHLRTIAHNTVLVHDPRETWPAIRGGRVTGNDGGQHHQWPHHNGAVSDPAQWHRQRDLYDIADLLAFEDHGDYVYVAGDATRAYSPEKLEHFTRQIVFLRPGTFIVFDRVKAKDAAMKKTWLLQAMEVPTGEAPHLVVTNGRGRLFIQTLLPADAETRLCSGDDLYSYGGRRYPPSRDTGPAPKCRIEVSPSAPSETDTFLHVLTATGVETGAVPWASVAESPLETVVSVGPVRIALAKDRVAARIASTGGWITLGNRGAD
jgi:hypothetical protein